MEIPKKIIKLQKVLKDCGIKQKIEHREENKLHYLPEGFVLDTDKDFLIVFDKNGDFQYYCNTQQ